MIGARQRVGKAFQTVEIMTRPKGVDMGQHGPDAPGARLETTPPQERIQPDQPTAGALKQGHVTAECAVGVSVKAVSDQDHHGPMPENAP